MPIFVPLADKDMPRQMVAPLTEQKLQEVFKKLDTNKNGQLDKAELKEAFRSLGSVIPGWRAKRALHHADADGDGSISVNEMNDVVEYAAKLGFALK